MSNANSQQLDLPLILLIFKVLVHVISNILYPKEFAISKMMIQKNLDQNNLFHKLSINRLLYFKLMTLKVTNEIIVGTRTKVNKFTTNRHTNPLQPKYQEPHVVYIPFPQTKFIRDNMQIDVNLGLNYRILRESEVVRHLLTGQKDQAKSLTPKVKFLWTSNLPTKDS